MQYFYTLDGVIYWPLLGFTLNGAQYTPGQLDDEFAAELGMTKVYIQPAYNYVIFPDQVLQTDGSWEIVYTETLEQTIERLCSDQYQSLEQALKSVEQYGPDAPKPVTIFRSEVVSIYEQNCTSLQNCESYDELQVVYPLLLPYPGKPFGY